MSHREEKGPGIKGNEMSENSARQVSGDHGDPVWDGWKDRDFSGRLSGRQVYISSRPGSSFWCLEVSVSLTTGMENACWSSEAGMASAHGQASFSALKSQREGNVKAGMEKDACVCWSMGWELVCALSSWTYETFKGKLKKSKWEILLSLQF